MALFFGELIIRTLTWKTHDTKKGRQNTCLHTMLEKNRFQKGLTKGQRQGGPKANQHEKIFEALFLMKPTFGLSFYDLLF